MMINLAKVALRNSRKHLGYTLINVLSLAVGMACCLLIMAWVLQEISFDRFHENIGSLYRVEENQTYSGRVYHVNVTPYPLAPALKAEVPEIAQATRVVRFSGRLFRAGDQSFFEDNFRAVDPAFLEMFTFPLAQGSRVGALADPRSILLTETTARKYFADENPLGKVITLDDSDPMTVTGVLHDLPLNSTYQFDGLVPYSFLESRKLTSDSFDSNSISTYVQLRPGVAMEQVNPKIAGFIKKRVEGALTDLELAPFARLHLYAYFGYDMDMQVKYVYIFSFIAAFVLLIACINFMNLSTARSANRAKEIGLRKVVGAARWNLVAQFLLESVSHAVLALLLAFGLGCALLHAFNDLTGQEISLATLMSPGFLGSALAITLITGVLAGSYPALLLSSFRPAGVLAGKLKAGASTANLRRGLVVFQFTLSTFLMIGTVVVNRQLQHMKTASLGYDKDNLVCVPLRPAAEGAWPALRNGLLKDSRIRAVTASTDRPSNIGSNSGGADWDGKDPTLEVLITQSGVDFDYTEALGIEIVEGRSFSRDFESDRKSGFLINEELRRIMGKAAAAGERFSFHDTDGQIVGVMKDFHYDTLRNRIEPLALYMVPAEELRTVLVRLAGSDLADGINAIRQAWTKAAPGCPFEYGFVDEDFEQMYQREQRAGGLLNAFAVLAVIIGCLGLFGLASFLAEQRTREVGIRKVLGASVSHIVLLLNREFVVLVVAANVLAWPLAYWAMRAWLRSYAYRTDLAAWIFFNALLLELIVTMLTVSYQSVRTARTDPVRTLKHE